MASQNCDGYNPGVHGETTISILRRLIESGHADLPHGAAEAVLHFHFQDSDQSRMSELATKCNHGKLTPAEAEEYDGYIAAADLLSLWKSKARSSLKRHPSAV